MLGTLNERFFKDCVINYEKYNTEYGGNIISIPNFFKNFRVSKNFFISRDSWESNDTGYLDDITADLASTCILPNWIVSELLNKYFMDKKIANHTTNYTCFVKHSYHEMGSEKLKKFPQFRFVGKGIIPHIDLLPGDNPEGTQEYICLVNLNKFPISTLFWEYNGINQIITHEQNKSYQDFILKFEKENENINEKDIKLPNDIRIKYKKTYQPNECIIYPSNLLHGPYIEETYNQDNLRSILKMTYIEKI